MIFEWLKDNSDPLSLLAQFAGLFVWLLFGYLLLSNYLRQRKARIVIGRGSHAGSASVAMISNMGEEYMFIVCVIAVVRTRAGTFSREVTESGMAEDSGLADGLRQITGKGPLEAGGVMALPSFEALLRQATDGTDLAATDEDSAPQLRAVESVELRVGFVYGPEAHPWGARRRFRVLSEEAAHGSYKFVPETLHTERYYSRRHRRKVRAWLEQCR